LPDGTVYYTMKKVEGRSLDQILRGIRKADPEISRQFTLLRMLSIVQQVCLGMEYAHARGVIHRDLKPANIMLGDFGEVLILDWGLAKVVGQPDPEGEDEESMELEPVELSEGAQLKTRDGYVQGTPPFMAPEQAKNERDKIGPWSDVYALGGILYQALTRKLHFHGKNPRDVMIRCVEEDPTPPIERAPHLRVPEELSAICMRALIRDPKKRIRSAGQLSEEIESFMEGTKRREAAQKRVAEGRKAMEMYHATRLEADRLQEEVHKALSVIRGWEKLEEKAAAWEMEDRLDESEREVAVAFLKAEGIFEQALAYDDRNEGARSGLAALYWTRFRDAETRRDVADQIYYEGLIRRNDDGRYAERLRGDGLMSVATHRAGAEV
ncbi:MAG: protein kinase, partial [Myxococcota bacterium]|nr:protein kinase [Myxococcota bacterium]